MKKEEFKKVKIGDKEYKFGFPTRRDAKNAEKKGLDITATSKILTLADKIFYTGLLANHPYIEEDEAERLEEEYIDNGGNLDEITSFLMEQFMAFIKSPNGQQVK